MIMVMRNHKKRRTTGKIKKVVIDCLMREMEMK